MNFNTYETLALAGFVLLLGYFLVKRISLLKNYNIPEPVVGGFLVAIILRCYIKVGVFLLPLIRIYKHR